MNRLTKLFPVLAAGLLCACTPGAHRPGSGAVPVGSPVVGGAAHVYACGDGYTFTLHEEPERTRFIAEGVEVDVKPVEGGYAGKGLRVRIDAEIASVTWVDTEVAHERCARDGVESVWETTRLRGFDLRASGNEPGWVLELREGDVSYLSADYGLLELSFDTPAPAVSAAPDGAVRTRYTTKVDGAPLTIEVKQGSCEDFMSGQSMELFVTVRMGGRIFYGCGRSLR